MVIPVLSNLQTRLKMVASAFSTKAPTRSTQPAMMLFPSWREGQPQWQMVDLQAYTREGYNMNALIHDAVSYKARALMQAPQRAFGESMESPVRQLPNHPLSKLLSRPNPYQSQAEYQQIRMTYLNLAGNTYTYLQRDKTGALPVAMWCLRPDWVYIIPDAGGGIKGYLYRPDGYVDHQSIPILPEDMIHIKFPNPSDPLGGLGYGMSPITPIAQSADVDNEITRFLKKFFENKTMIGGVLKFNTPLDDATVAQARRRWAEVYGGAENWGDIAILDQGGEYQRIAMTFKEMDFSALDKRNETRILGPFGVPGILIETLAGLEHATYSNKAAARVMFWEDTMNSEITLLDSDDQYYLTTPDGVYPMHDKSGVPALQKNIPELVNAAEKMWKMGTPRDDAYRVVGLNVPATKDGQTGYIPGSMIEVGAPRPQPLPPTTPVKPDATDPSSTTEAEDEQDALEDTATVENDGKEGAKALTTPDTFQSAEVKADTAPSRCVYLSLANEPQLLALQQLAKAANPALDLTLPEHLHITLAYAQDISDAAFATAYAQVDNPAKLSVIGTSLSTFEPDEGQPTPIVLNIKFDAALGDFQNSIREALEAQGVTITEYTLTWIPHVTLGYCPDKVALPAMTDEITLSPSAVCWSREDYVVVHETPLSVGKASRWTEAEKKAIWLKMDSIAVSHEPAFTKEARAQFEADKRAILALVTDGKEKALQRKASIDWLEIEDEINKYIFDSSAPDWRERFAPVMTAVVEDAGNYWSAQTGFAFNVRNLMGEAWFSNYQLRFAQAVSETTSNTMHDIIAQGMAEGWSIPEMQAHMTQTFQQWMVGGGNPEDFDWLASRMPPYRTEMIARTETIGISNAGSHELFRSWSIETRSWLSTRDDRTRDDHIMAEVNGQNVPMDEEYNVGGSTCMYPGDPSLPPKQRINCRCTEIPDV
jgi:HK97 family phage portal protein